MIPNASPRGPQSVPETPLAGAAASASTEAPSRRSLLSDSGTDLVAGTRVGTELSRAGAVDAPPTTPPPAEASSGLIRRPSLALRRDSPSGLVRRDSASGEVADLVFLPEVTENAVVDALVRRYNHSRIYTYVGDVVLSLNPFKAVDIYGDKEISMFRDNVFYSNKPPHIYALANRAYRNVVRTNQNQCVLITGESGSGKTEASKIIVGYLAAVTAVPGAASSIDGIRRVLIESNPALEALGNAQTASNDNSSRFGKYFEIALDHRGCPVGGHVQTYLLEKTRVTGQAEGERNFHAFYQLLAGADDALVQSLSLAREPKAYRYLKHGNGEGKRPVDDAAGFSLTRRALDAMGMSLDDVHLVYTVLAAILHIGNVRFASHGSASGASARSSDSDAPSPVGSPTALRRSRTTTPDGAAAAAEIRAEGHFERGCALLQCDAEVVRVALTRRTVDVNARDAAECIEIPLDRRQARDARDALCRALYLRLFEWVVAKINISMSAERVRGAVHSGADGGGGGVGDCHAGSRQSPSPQPPCMSPRSPRSSTPRSPVIGILDIYGFEIFKLNGFEQFCINYCNERLQQLFVRLTLGAEQAEYAEEGIPWARRLLQ
eukprot:Opistho-2@64101